MDWFRYSSLKTKVLAVILLIVIVCIVGVSTFGMVREKKEADHAASIQRAAEVSGYDEDEVYHVNTKTVVNFKEPIIEQFNKESQLVVSSADAVVELQLKQTGVLDIKALNKTQIIKYRGTGRFYVDMSQLSEEDITVDEENKTVTLSIPHTQLLPVDIDPDRFESEDAKKGLLAFGDLKFTPVEYNNLQTECKNKLEGKINTKENRLKADENALAEIIKIYEPIVKSLDEEYTFNAVFNDATPGVQ